MLGRSSRDNYTASRVRLPPIWHRGALMSFVQLFRSSGVSLMAVFFVAACANSHDPAKHAVENVNAAVSVVSSPAQKYLPDQFTALQARVSTLKASFDKGDYKQVLTDAPTLLNDTQALGAAAAAKEDQAMKGMASEWTGLTASIPDRIAAVQERIDALNKDKKDAAKVDFPAAKASMADVNAMWSRAQEAFAAGHLESAVEIARAVRQKTEAAATSLKLPLPKAAAAH
jgi:hypothetical protein